MRDSHFEFGPAHTRRDFVFGLGATLGTVAFNSIVQAEESRVAAEPTAPLAARQPHHPPRATACVFVYLEGGPSHIDLVDPKPKLRDLHLKEFTRNDRFASNMANGKRYFVQSPFRFRHAGHGELSFCEPFSHLPNVADELCVYRGCVAESIDHPTACFHMNTGNRFGGDAAIGAWVSYGLGTLNQNLPSFVVLPEQSYPQGGSGNWSNGFLPAYHQGTTLRPIGSPILDLFPPQGVTPQMQRANLNLLAELNRSSLEGHPAQDDLAARLQSYELAFRMQAQVPDLIDLNQENRATLSLYGVDEPATDEFARKCLLARRLIERGVRFVQLWSGGWDSHDYLERAHSNRIRSIDRPLAALVSDLKRRGMLDTTLVVCCGEFGRSPDNGIRAGGVAYGRDHNAKAMFVLLAGAGISGGHYVGQTDDIGEKAVDVVHPIKDLHVTLLHLLGLNDNKLTYFHGGRFKQLSQVGGELIRELTA